MMMKRVFLMITLMIFSGFFTYAKSVEKKEQKIDLTQMMKDMTLTYSEVEYMTASVIKLQESLILGTKDKTKASLHYSKGKTRLEFDTKPKSTLIMGDEFFWQIVGNEVTTGRIDQKTFPNIFLDIFSKPSVWDDIKLKLQSEVGQKITVSVETKDKFSGISELYITIDKKKKTILNLKYIDDVQNSVAFDFKRIRFKKKSPKGQFSYKPKKKDTVNRL